MPSLFLAAVAAALTVSITASGPNGPLQGTLIDAGSNAPVVLILPGSGPTDRDGNNPMGVTAAPYKLLGEALATKGVSTVRIDKRGMFGSKSAILDANAVTIADYATDTHSWVKAIRERTGAKCVWVLGHSEGGLIALASVQHPEGICGVILVSTAGRPIGEVIREQLRSNPANAPILPDAMKAIDSLEAGKTIDVSAMHPALQQLFAPQVQPFLIDLMAADPTKLAANATVPMLIVQGGRDLQVSKADAEALGRAQRNAKLVEIPTMNHVLKDVGSDDKAANVSAYADPSLPIDPTLVETVAAFVRR
jgi:pimeloyl-ACP methyl ester carboxylesterase